ncbi:MAG: DNA topoisomerase 3 [Sporomusaceae bacterium]|nr:DNA topoisomerase 3 [Sporomusaceae bacterium]
MKLFIAEKPSMAAEIAKCLPGPMLRKDGHIETGGGVVTWVFGHILRQAEPGEYDEKYKKWRVSDLPIIPEEWKLLVADSCKKQFKIIKDLLGRASEVVHAGDPDREGQLLVDEVLGYTSNKKPVMRMIVNALDEKSIKKALITLRDNKDFYNLNQSALARSRADWLVGMNLSRAFTLAAQGAGHDVTFPIGRVKTPTLALVVRREREIKEFGKADYFLIKADIKHVNGEFRASWKPKEDQLGRDTEGRLVDAAIAKTLVDKLQDAKEPAQIMACDTLEKKEPQRLPFSLSALQVLAGRKYGYDPQAVLTGVQSLYEKKYTSYPRSDCDFLPESQHTDAPAILEHLQRSGNTDLSAWSAKADPRIQSRAWNDKKITAHHAIIPTEVPCKLAGLNEIERNLYTLIAQAYIAQFYPIHVYNQTRAEIKHADEDFTATGRVIVTMGWKEVYGTEPKEEEDEDSKTLPAMQQGDNAEFIRAILEKKTTKPPTRFTSSTLLQAMKEIHKYVKNPELKKNLKDVSGIGTEATRASIIKELITRNFLKESKKYLYPTDGAYLLIDSLPDELTYPDSTAIWEIIFNRMVDGSAQLTSFIDQQTQFITDLCCKAKEIKIENQDRNAYQCPRCKRGVLKLRNGKNGSFWGCARYPECTGTCNDKDGKPQLAN